MAYLITLPPPPILPLMTQQEPTGLPHALARRIRFAHERQALQRELRRVSVADCPGSVPAAFRTLGVVEVLHGFLYCFPGVGVLLALVTVTATEGFLRTRCRLSCSLDEAF